MTKLLLISDSHGDKAALRRVLDKESDADVLFFLGDGAADVDAVLPQLERRPPAYMVSGNCDHGSFYPPEGMVAFEGTSVFYTHGHLYGVGYAKTGLLKIGQLRGADIILFGPPHSPFSLEMPDFPRMYNPGSISRPRSAEGPTYGVLLLDRGQEPRFQLCSVPPKD